MFQAALWCRQMKMPAPEDGDRKWGLDDLLVHQNGKSVIDAALKDELGGALGVDVAVVQVAV